MALRNMPQHSVVKHRVSILNLVFTFSFLWIISCCATPENNVNPTLKPGIGLVEVEGGKVWYGIMGEGNSAPLLCLHGGPGGTSRSYFNLSEIANERPVIMFDQLGSGRSDHHQDTSLLKVDKFVEQVEAIRKALNLEEFYLMGSSWGSALALEYYLAYPEGIKGVIFGSPYFSTPIWTEDASILVSSLPDSIQQSIQKAEVDSVFDSQSYEEANTYFAKNFGKRKESVKHPYDTVESNNNTFIYNYMWGPTEFTATGTLRTYDNHLNLKKVKIPSLFTTGEFDEARPETVKKLSQMVPNAKFVVIPDAGHATLNDNRPAMLTAIQEFLSAQEHGSP